MEGDGRVRSEKDLRGRRIEGVGSCTLTPERPVGQSEMAGNKNRPLQLTIDIGRVSEPHEEEQEQKRNEPRYSDAL
jgi:hypothetical protein